MRLVSTTFSLFLSLVLVGASTPHGNLDISARHNRLAQRSAAAPASLQLRASTTKKCKNRVNNNAPKVGSSSFFFFIHATTSKCSVFRSSPPPPRPKFLPLPPPKLPLWSLLQRKPQRPLQRKLQQPLQQLYRRLSAALLTSSQAVDPAVLLVRYTHKSVMIFA